MWNNFCYIFVLQTATIMKKIIISIIFFSFIALSCQQTKHEKLLPGSTGKTHNILIIMDDQDWKKSVGDSLRKYLASEFTDLPQSEAEYTLHQASPELFTDIFKTIRDIIIIKKGDKNEVKFFKDKFAQPQLIVKVEGKNNEEIKKLLYKHAQEITEHFNKFEIEHLQALHRQTLRNSEDIEKELGITIEIPDYFALVDHQKNFFWFRRDVKNGEADLLLYSVPLKDESDLKGKRVLDYRDSIGKKYIPGPSDSTYMKSERNLSPSQVMTMINDKKAIETRGLWKMENDFMGGPYVNYSIIDKKNNRMIVGEGVIYAPAIDKRDYMVQLEAILRTIKLKTN